MGGTVNMGGKVLYMVIHLYNSCTQYSTGVAIGGITKSYSYNFSLDPY